MNVPTAQHKCVKKRQNRQVFLVLADKRTVTPAETAKIPDCRSHMDGNVTHSSQQWSVNGRGQVEAFSDWFLLLPGSDESASSSSFFRFGRIIRPWQSISYSTTTPQMKLSANPHSCNNGCWWRTIDKVGKKGSEKSVSAIRWPCSHEGAFSVTASSIVDCIHESFSPAFLQIKEGILGGGDSWFLYSLKSARCCGSVGPVIALPPEARNGEVSIS